MKVSELIEQIKRFDPDLMVVIPGYEGGFDEVSDILPLGLALNVNEEWYYGNHEDVTALAQPEISKFQTVKALCIGKRKTS